MIILGVVGLLCLVEVTVMKALELQDKYWKPFKRRNALFREFAESADF